MQWKSLKWLRFGLIALGAATAGAGLFIGLVRLASREAAAQVQLGPRVQIRFGAQAQTSDNDAGEGVFLPIDRETTRHWEKAKRLFEEGHYSDAAVLLDEIIKRDEDFFFKPDDDKPTLSSLKTEAQRLIGTMPPEGLQAYQLQFGVRAQQLLNAAIATGDAKALEEITRRYFHTQAGQEAALLLGRRQLDHGEPLAAALCFQRLLDSPQAAAQFEPELSVLLASCWLRAGRADRAEDVLLALKMKLPNAIVRVADKKVKLFSDDRQAVGWLTKNLGNPQPIQADESDNWELYRGNPARNAAAAGGIPLLNPRWRVSTTTHPILEKALADLRQQYIEQGVGFLPAMHPLAVGNLILMPTSRDVLAVDLESGKRLWPIRGSGDNAWEQMLGSSTGAMRIDAQANPWLTERFWWDATRGTLASDGRQVYLIKDLGGNIAGTAMPGGAALPMLRRRGFNIPNDSQAPTNKLFACELRTQGKLKWEVGGATGEEEPKLAGAFFLGPPLPLQDKLYVLAEIKGEIRLCVLDAASGHLDWSQQLAVVEANVQQDPLRRLAGCTPSFADGVLVCPTAAGAVVAVDITTRSLLWGYLYSRSPQTAQNQIMFRGPVVAFGADAAGNPLERWTDASATIADGCVLITPPESNELHCLRLATGRPVWRKPVERGENLYVACVHQGSVVLVGKRQLTALRLTDGKPAWHGKSLDLPDGAMPSGRGFLSGDDYFLPMTTAEVAQIDLTSGKITARAKSHKGGIPGNLICCRGQVISQGVDYLEAFFQLKPVEERIAKALEKNPEDAWALAHRGEIALDNGRLNEALADIRRSYKVDADAFTRDLLIEALTTALQQDFAAHRDAVPELENLVRLDRQRAAFYRVLATGLQKTGDSLGSLDAYLKLAALEPPEEAEEISSSLSVSRDRWVRAQFDTLLTQAHGDERRKIDAVVEKQLNQALAAKQSKAVERFLSNFGDHPLADRAREALVEQIGDSESSLAREQLLRRLEQSNDPARRKTAMARLAALLHAAGHDYDARSYYGRLQAEFGDQPVLGGKSVKQLLADVPADSPLRAADASSAAWPLGEVTVEKSGVKQQRMPGFGINAKLDIRGPREPFFQDVTLDFDQQRMELVARDGLGQERFRQSLNESGRMQNFFGNVNALSYYATTNGHVVVVCLGMQAFAVDTLRAANAPNRLLWSQSLTDASTSPFNLSGMSFQPAQMPWGGRRIVVKLQNQYLGNVGPCTANGVCIQQGHEVMCLDCITGKVQWVRHGVPTGSEIFGDDEITLLAPPEGTAAEALVIRTIDGELLGKRSVPPADQRWSTVGRRILTWRNTTGNKLLITLHDPWERRDVWSATFAPGSRGAVVRDESVAVMQPDGKFAMIRISDGGKTIDEKLEAESNLLSIHVLRSGGQDILITNRTYIADRPQQRIVQLPQVNNDPSWLPITGRIYAFDRATGKPQWPAPAAVEQHGLVLNAPAELPVIVFLRTIVMNQSQQHASVLCLDKRTGRAVYDDDELPQAVQSYDLSGDAKEKTVAVVAAPSQTVTLNFTDAPIPPEPPYQAGLFDKPKRIKAEALFNAIRNQLPILDPTNAIDPAR